MMKLDSNDHSKPYISERRITLVYKPEEDNDYQKFKLDHLWVIIKHKYGGGQTLQYLNRMLLLVYIKHVGIWINI